MIKAIGFVMVLLSGVLLALKTRKEYQSRIEELECFLESFQVLKSEILHLKTPLKEIFEKIADDSNRTVGLFFRHVTAEMSNCSSLQTVWNSGLEKYRNLFCLDKKDIQILADFSVLLGQTDFIHQSENIDSVTEKLNLQLEKARQEQKQNTKPRGTLYVAGALVIGILFL